MPGEALCRAGGGQRAGVIWIESNVPGQLEDGFLGRLIAEIDEGRDPEQGLASAVRVWLLKRASR